MGDARILQNWLVVGALPLAAILSLHRFLDSRNLYRELLAGLMFLEFIGKMAVGAPYVQYFIFSNLVSALIAADYAVGQIRLKRVKLLLLAGGCGGDSPALAPSAEHAVSALLSCTGLHNQKFPGQRADYQYGLFLFQPLRAQPFILLVRLRQRGTGGVLSVWR